MKLDSNGEFHSNAGLRPWLPTAAAPRLDTPTADARRLGERAVWRTEAASGHPCRRR